MKNKSEMEDLYNQLLIPLTFMLFILWYMFSLGDDIILSAKRFSVIMIFFSISLLLYVLSKTIKKDVSFKLLLEIFSLWSLLNLLFIIILYFIANATTFILDIWVFLGLSIIFFIITCKIGENEIKKILRKGKKK